MRGGDPAPPPINENRAARVVPARPFAGGALLSRHGQIGAPLRLRERPLREAAPHPALGRVAVEEVEDAVAQPLAEPRLPSLIPLLAAAVLVVVTVGISGLSVRAAPSAVTPSSASEHRPSM